MLRNYYVTYIYNWNWNWNWKIVIVTETETEKKWLEFNNNWKNLWSKTLTETETRKQQLK